MRLTTTYHLVDALPKQFRAEVAMQCTFPDVTTRMSIRQHAISPTGTPQNMIRQKNQMFNAALTRLV